MKRNYIKAFAAAFLIFTAGCSNTGDSRTAENETAAETTVYSETAETVSETLCVTEAVPVKTEPMTWQEAYADYIESEIASEDDFLSYSLIYLDDNEIPELFISTGYEAGGEMVITYYDGQVIMQPLSRLGSVYIERSGLIYTNTGHMGNYPLYIRKLENGEFSLIAYGEHLEYRDGDEDIITYEWEEEAVSEEEFDNNIDALFDREQAVRPVEYSREEMLSLLKTGACTSAGHRYELIEENVTWEEACELCQDKGGYLATITSPDEHKAIAAQIAKEGKQNISFYVGYRRSEWEGDEFYSRRWINKDGSFTSAAIVYCHYYSAPNYDARQPEWESGNRKCGLLKYYDDEEQMYLFEAPEDLLLFSPEYTDKMGYICEFDE